MKFLKSPFSSLLGPNIRPRKPFSNIIICVPSVTCWKPWVKQHGEKFVKCFFLFLLILSDTSRNVTYYFFMSIPTHLEYNDLACFFHMHSTSTYSFTFYFMLLISCFDSPLRLSSASLLVIPLQLIRRQDVRKTSPSIVAVFLDLKYGYKSVKHGLLH